MNSYKQSSWSFRAGTSADGDRPGCASAMLFLLAFIGNGFFATWVASVLWAWFAVTLFAVPALTFWQVYALRLLMRVMRGYKHTLSDGKKTKWSDGVQSMIASYAFYATGLVLGWLVHHFAGIG